MRALRAVLAVIAPVAASAAIAPAAQAAWQPAVDLGPGSRLPAIGFGPRGDAALAWGAPAGAADDEVTVVDRRFGGPFGAPVTVSTGVSDPGPDLQVVLADDGATILRTGARLLVAPPRQSTFGPGQDLGGVQEGDLGPPEARLTPTLAGETIASVTSSQGFESAAALEPGSAAFGPEQALTPFDDNIGNVLSVAGDTAGTAFIADDTLCARSGQAAVAVATRRPHGRFETATVLPCQPNLTPDTPPTQLSAAGSGRAVVLAVTGPFGHYVLWAITRTHGRFGAPRVLTRSRRRDELLEPLGPPVIGLGGRVTAGWDVCDLSGGRCAVTAAEGSLAGGGWRTRTFASPSTPAGLGGQIGDGYIVLSRCGRYTCRVSVADADRHGRFGTPRTLTTDGDVVSRDQLTEASSGRRRVRAIVWSDSRGGVFATVANPGQSRFGAVRRLAADGSTSGNQVGYETGPRDQVIVAWLTSRLTVAAATYSPT